MKTNPFIAQLRSNPTLPMEIVLPHGGRVPAHFHVTEVGHVEKKFVDCGGTFRTSETCQLQVFVGSPRDDGHRLTAGKLAHILDLAKPILPARELPIEIEYEDAVISQFSVEDVGSSGDRLVLRLGHKYTDCLAKDRCGIEQDCGCGVPDNGGAGCGTTDERVGCC